jgi:hypothetical protein
MVTAFSLTLTSAQLYRKAGGGSCGPVGGRGGREHNGYVGRPDWWLGR